MLMDLLTCSFLVVLWTSSSSYLEHHLINIGEVGMASPQNTQTRTKISQ